MLLIPSMKMQVCRRNLLLLVIASLSLSSAEEVAPNVDASTPEKESIPQEAANLYKLPVVDKDDAYLFEPFAHLDSKITKSKWIRSQSKKDKADNLENEKYEGEWAIESTNISRMDGDHALVLKSAAKHHGIAINLDRPFVFNGKPFVFQYDVKFTNGQECGGGYVKLLQEGALRKLDDLNDKTPYTIMFGPDKCGKEAHLRFIFQHRNPISGAFQEKHWKEPTTLKTEEQINSKKTHLYTLVINPDSTFQVYVDQRIVGDGSLLQDVTPPVNPANEIEDPNDKKPADWDERKTISDPNAKKPDTWDENAPQKIPDPAGVKPDGWLEDEPEMIHDLEAVRPEDWDVDMDGEWEAPLTENPKCKGVGCGPWKAPLVDNPVCKAGGCGPWNPPMIDNPNYKGKWSAQRIPNPDFFDDKEPYKMTPIGALGLELWTINNEIVFDNFLVTSDKSVADRIASETWKIKEQMENASGSLAGKLNYTYIGISIALVVGLAIIVLLRSYFRKQNLVADEDDFQPPQIPQEPTKTTVRPDEEAEVPVAEAEEGSGDNMESQSASAESASDVDAEAEDSPSKPLVQTKESRTTKRTQVRRED